MGILSGLKDLGLGGLENMDIFEDKSKQKEKDKEKDKEIPEIMECAAVKKVEEKDLVFDRSYKCPVCQTSFTSKSMKSSKAKLIGTDRDLRPRHEGIDSIKYDVVLCPVCGYAALARYFPNLSPGQIKLIREKISRTVQFSVNEGEVYTYEEALQRYELALANAMVKRSKASEKAYICLKTGWLMRGYADFEGKKDMPDEKLIAELKKQESEFMQHAYKGFTEARRTENTPICGMDQLTIDYLLAVLAMGEKEYEVAGRLIVSILTNSAASARVKDKARTLKDEVVKELRKR